MLDTLELDERPLVVEDSPELSILRRRQVTLRLHDKEVRLRPGLEPGFLGRQLLLAKLTSHSGGGDPLLDTGDLQGRVRHLGRDA